jgi:hypothetical protein
MTENEQTKTEQIFVADTIFTLGELDCLTSGLRAVFRTPDSSASPAEIERARLQAGLLIVADFVKASGIGNDVANYLAALAGYLSDLDKGITHPVLARTKTAGAPGVAYTVWMARVPTVLGFECFVAAGDGVEQAARFLSKRYPLLKKLCRSGEDLKGSLISWRKAGLAGTMGDESAQEAFTAEHKTLLHAIGDLTNENKKVQGHNLMQRAAVHAEELVSNPSI